MDKGLTRPPNPSRLANGQGFRPPPPPFTTCKWTRVAGPPTLHDLGAASKWTRVGAPPQPFTTCKWTRVAPPNPSRLADAQGLGAPTLHELRMDEGWGHPNPSRLANLKFCLDKHWGLQTIERLSIFHRGPGASPQIETSMTSPSSQNVR